jgi:hypothetical protein
MHGSMNTVKMGKHGNLLIKKTKTKILDLLNGFGLQKMKNGIFHGIGRIQKV